MFKVSSFKSSMTPPAFKWKPRSPYTAVETETDEDEEQSDPCLEKGQPKAFLIERQWRGLGCMNIFPWLLALSLALISFYQYLDMRNFVGRLGTFETGWRTDFYPAKVAIGVEQVRFTGSPSFYDNGTMFIPHPDPIKYGGDGPDVDQAWEELTGGRYIRISEEEARNTWGDAYTEFWDEARGGYVAGLDMFHTLHCVNRLRQLTPAKLEAIQSSQDARLHHYHCLSQIRQYIMCSGDLTPIPTKYYTSLGRNYVDSDVPHTCRNFKQIREWTWERFNGSLAVPRRQGP